MTLKQYQLEKGYGNTIKHWKESKRQIDRKREKEGQGEELGHCQLRIKKIYIQ